MLARCSKAKSFQQWAMSNEIVLNFEVIRKPSHESSVRNTVV